MLDIDDLIRRAEEKAAANNEDDDSEEPIEPEGPPKTEADELFDKILYDALVIVNLEYAGKCDESYKLAPVEMQELYQALETKEVRLRAMRKSEADSHADGDSR